MDLNSTDTQRLYLTTRFLQLEVAAELEAWQDAYRTIEDIHENMTLSKQPAPPELMVPYYERLTQIFWASGNYLFHAYSMERLYMLGRGNPKLTDEDRRRSASAVLLSTLVVPPTDRYGEQLNEESFFDTHDEGNLRLANMLGFKKEVLWSVPDEHTFRTFLSGSNTR